MRLERSDRRCGGEPSARGTASVGRSGTKVPASSVRASRHPRRGAYERIWRRAPRGRRVSSGQSSDGLVRKYAIEVSPRRLAQPWPQDPAHFLGRDGERVSAQFLFLGRTWRTAQEPCQLAHFLWSSVDHSGEKPRDPPRPRNGGRAFSQDQGSIVIPSGAEPLCVMSRSSSETRRISPQGSFHGKNLPDTIALWFLPRLLRTRILTIRAP